MQSKIASKAQNSNTKVIDSDVKKWMRSYISKIFLIVYAVNNIFTSKRWKTQGVSGIPYGRSRNGKVNSGFENAANIALKVNNQLYKDYKNKIVKYVYVSKLNSVKCKRIPMLLDRIIQKMFQLVIEPAVDVFGDPNSYGFRNYRSCHNAIGALASRLTKTSQNFIIIDTSTEKLCDTVNHN
jgi:retron-type reverse transcriptase